MLTDFRVSVAVKCFQELLNAFEHFLKALVCLYGVFVSVCVLGAVCTVCCVLHGGYREQCMM